LRGQEAELVSRVCLRALVREFVLGADELTFANDHQPIPARVKFMFDRKNSQVHVSVTMPQFGLNVKQILDRLRLQQAMSKGGNLRVIHLDSGLRLFELAISAGRSEPPDVQQIEAMEDFVAVQMKVARPINLPDRELTPDEMNLLNKLRHILHIGSLQSQWEKPRYLIESTCGSGSAARACRRASTATQLAGV
jgi:hypothetical protein